MSLVLKRCEERWARAQPARRRRRSSRRARTVPSITSSPTVMRTPATRPGSITWLRAILRPYADSRRSESALACVGGQRAARSARPRRGRSCASATTSCAWSQRLDGLAAPRQQHDVADDRPRRRARACGSRESTRARRASIGDAWLPSASSSRPSEVTARRDGEELGLEALRAGRGGEGADADLLDRGDEVALRRTSGRPRARRAGSCACRPRPPATTRCARAARCSGRHAGVDQDRDQLVRRRDGPGGREQLLAEVGARDASRREGLDGRARSTHAVAAPIRRAPFLLLRSLGGAALDLEVGEEAVDERRRVGVGVRGARRRCRRPGSAPARRRPARSSASAFERFASIWALPWATMRVGLDLRVALRLGDDALRVLAGLVADRAGLDPRLGELRVVALERRVGLPLGLLGLRRCCPGSRRTRASSIAFIRGRPKRTTTNRITAKMTSDQTRS